MVGSYARGVRVASRLGAAVITVAALSAAPVSAGPFSTASALAATGPSLTVDVSAGRHAISPDIYGMNFADAALAQELHLTSDRWGGNATSRYNYANNTHNTGSDYFFENIVGGTSMDSFIAADLAHGTQPLVTVPTLGWVAKNSPSSHPFACGFKVSKYGAQQSTDPYDPDCGNGKRSDGSAITGNAPSDTSQVAGTAFVQAMVTHLKQANPGVKAFELDNEPSLWNSTHRDVHPAPLSYDELWQRSRDTAAAIKSAAAATGSASSTVDGPGDWGWCAYFYAPTDGCADGPDRRAHGDLPLAAYYLRQFQTYQQQHGTRLLDYFDEHFYPQESGVALASAGSAATQALRLRSTRTLWDPSYVDESWTTDLGLGPVNLIPRMKQWVAQYYPGTKTAISEYNWGGLESINGALAQADVLGIFGREGLNRAELWSPPSSSQPGAFAFRMFRNYDGQGHRFGDTAVHATSSDQGSLSVYAAQRGGDHAITVVVINKSGSALTSTLRLQHATGSTARVYAYSATHLSSISRLANSAISGGVLTRSYPANSITLLVI
jgi:hypothetical protein